MQADFLPSVFSRASSSRDFFLHVKLYSSCYVCTFLGLSTTVFVGFFVCARSGGGHGSSAREIRARRGLCWQQSAGGSIACFSRVPGRCQWCGRRGLSANRPPQTLCVTRVPRCPLPGYLGPAAAPAGAPPRLSDRHRSLVCACVSVEWRARRALTLNPVPSTLFPAFFSYTLFRDPVNAT